MHSKKLKEIIRMVMDVRSMDGPVTRRALAEEVAQIGGSQYLSAADQYEAYIQCFMAFIKAEMNLVHSEEFLAREGARLPEDIRGTLRKIPQWICTSARGGRGSEHVKAIFATPEHWAANFALKDQIVEATRVSRNESRDIKNLLESSGVTCIADLIKDRAA